MNALAESEYAACQASLFCSMIYLTFCCPAEALDSTSQDEPG